MFELSNGALVQMTSSARVCTGALFLCLLLALPHHSVASTSTEIWALVDKYASRYGIPLAIARNLVRVESGGRQDAVSPSGARGVMQLTPATAQALGVDFNDAEQNIEGGMRYLRQQFDRFGRWDLALAAYHSGPQAVIKYGGVPPKSQSFVRRIMGTSAVASRGTEPRLIPPGEAHSDTRQLARGFSWPVVGPITNGFGGGQRGTHAGLDISAPQGTPIRASRAGVVTYSSWYYDYGYTVIVDHGGGVSSLYGHVSKLLVSVGQPVQKGDVIALVGCTGRCTGPHVHFEVRVDGRAVDPLNSDHIADSGN
jgi:murein DD-endopeptidase MepM/ murein hydrolase activator NlpD